MALPFLHYKLNYQQRGLLSKSNAAWKPIRPPASLFPTQTIIAKYTCSSINKTTVLWSVQSNHILATCIARLTSQQFSMHDCIVREKACRMTLHPSLWIFYNLAGVTPLSSDFVSVEKEVWSAGEKREIEVRWVTDGWLFTARTYAGPFLQLLLQDLGQVDSRLILAPIHGWEEQVQCRY